MEMTVPVTTRMEQRPAPGTYNKKMCFLLPQEWQQSPLQPTSKDVSIEKMELDVLVKRFSGYLPGAFEDAKWINHARHCRLAPLYLYLQITEQFYSREEVESAKLMNLLNQY